MKQSTLEIIPFNADLAKKIVTGEIDGQIIHKDGDFEMISFEMDGDMPNLGLLKYPDSEKKVPFLFRDSTHDVSILIAAKYTFNHGEYITVDFDSDGEKVKIIAAFDELTEDGHVKYLFMLSGAGRICVNGICTSSHLKWRRANTSEKLTLLNELRRQTNLSYYIDTVSLFETHEYDFQPYDKVIVRSGESGVWKANFYSHPMVAEGSGNILHVCAGGVWKYCIPYNSDNAKLIGTTKDYRNNA